jgi:putative ABC transport system permease protein
VQTLQAGLLILAATLMALGGFMAYNTFMAGVVERTREYALLRTICMRRGDVRRLALWEAAWISAAGVITGILLGTALSAGITRINAMALGYEARTLVSRSAASPWPRSSASRSPSWRRASRRARPPAPRRSARSAAPRNPARAAAVASAGSCWSPASR